MPTFEFSSTCKSRCKSCHNSIKLGELRVKYKGSWYHIECFTAIRNVDRLHRTHYWTFNYATNEAYRQCHPLLFPKYYGFKQLDLQSAGIIRKQCKLYGIEMPKSMVKKEIYLKKCKFGLFIKIIRYMYEVCDIPQILPLDLISEMANFIDYLEDVPI